MAHVLDQYTISFVVSDACLKKRCAACLISHRKLDRPPASLFLEDAHYCWICKMSNKNTLMNAEIVRIKTQRLLDEAHKHRFDNDSIKLFGQFKNWQHSCLFRVYNQAICIDIDAIVHQRTLILIGVKNYAPYDTFSGDKFGFSVDRIRVGRFWMSRFWFKRKTRCVRLLDQVVMQTVLKKFCWWSSDLRKGKAKTKSRLQLGLDYHANKKVWMTSTLLHAWIQRVNTYVRKKSE